MKTCSKCKQTKPREAFNKDRSKPDGLQTRCRECKRAADRTYAAANRERASARARAWREANQERKRANDAAYRQANREKITEYLREWYASNREEVREYRLARHYGITADQYAALLAYQGGRCAGCGVAECPTGRALSVDHDHGCCPPTEGTMVVGACGNCVRGLLCAPCNLADVLAGHPPVDWSAVMAGAGVAA